MSRMNRRRFLALAGGAAGVAAFGSIRWLGAAGQGASRGEVAGLKAFRQASYALGSKVSLTALHPSEQAARQAVHAAFAELDRIEQVMSLYRPDSEICTLNRTGRLDNPHPYLLTVLDQARQTSERTAGAFDVTVQPLWDLYATCNREGRPPTPSQLDTARAKVDWRRLDVSARTVHLPQPAAITLNGIAQGFAADQVLAVLRNHGIEHALVDTGEIGSLGRKADGQPWIAGIQHPRQPDAYVSLAALTNRSLSTSGDYATTFDDDFTQHHIFDPATGRSPQELAGVTVVARTATQADALSTAVFVLGLQRGRELVNATAGADALFVLKDGTVTATDNFPMVQA